MQKENKVKKAAKYVWIYETFIVFMCIIQWLFLLCCTKFNIASLGDLLEFIANKIIISTPYNACPSLIIYGVQKSSNSMIFLGISFLCARLVNIFGLFFKKKIAYFWVITFSAIDLIFSFGELFIDGFVNSEMFWLNIVALLFNVVICCFEVVFSFIYLSGAKDQRDTRPIRGGAKPLKKSN